MSDAAAGRAARRETVRNFKRAAILEAAGAVFAEHGLDGATMRAIAERAGYAPGAIYIHFDGKEAIYAELLGNSLDRLAAAVKEAAEPGGRDHARRTLRAFYDYYAEHPDELELGLYLFQGARPRGLSPDLDQRLNRQLIDIVEVMSDALHRETGRDPADPHAQTVGFTAHVVGCLIMERTGRLRVLGYTAGVLVDRRLDELLAGVGQAAARRE